MKIFKFSKLLDACLSAALPSNELNSASDSNLEASLECRRLYLLTGYVFSYPFKKNSSPKKISHFISFTWREIDSAENLSLYKAT